MVFDAKLALIIFGAKLCKNRSAHRRFRRPRIRPDFPLCEALREEHVEPRNAGDSFSSRKFEEARFERAINQVHHEIATKFGGGKRRNIVAWVHTNGRGIKNRVKYFRAKGAAWNCFATHRACEFFCSSIAPRADENLGARFCECKRRRAR